MKFSHKVVAASSILLLIILSLLTIQQYFSMKSELEHQVTQSVSEIVDGVRNTVAADIKGKKELSQYATDMLQTDLQNRDYVQSVISQSSIKQNFLLAGLGYEADGSNVNNDPGWNPGSEWDPRRRPWYIDAKNSGKLIITAPYADSATGEILVSIAVPVKENGRFAGAIFYDVSLAGLADVVNKVELFNAGFLFIVSGDGTIIAHPDVDKNGKQMNTFLPNVSIQEQTQEIELNGQLYATDFSKIPGEDWYVGVMVDESIAYAAVSELKNRSIVYTIIALVISIFALLFLIKVLMRPLDSLNDAIQDMASGQGDLTKRLDTNTDSEFAALASGFNTFAETLQQRIQRTKALSVEIRNVTETTAVGAQESASAMATQMQELEQLATAMNEMATTSSDVANNAQGAASAAKDADGATEDGTKVVGYTTQAISNLSSRIDEAVEQVKQLESATANIETILEVINDIADQTNLLALNAAIEAARAGESGRGFAVVADEVRTLAQRTQESTTEIRNMIEQLQSGATAVASAMGQSKETADDTVTKAQEANESLDRIRSAIQRISDMNIQIASAAEEQSLVAEEINNNTINIRDLSSQVAVAAEGANEAMALQTQHVRDQDEVMSKFIV
ncbi:methyl-accepting chemotaxis protein [Vibrio penaeicida]|uniref:methyl-accepting chemotaxis protein n=1 Tax=Vibrio penaeicida TaxID=104609 RepID=UPI002732C812|nr:methyl-accepting chemotaxis protein [Vibrio penaeicida]MDP2572100.1 methyl-accepting chemotaxis protein [Vibrio penaeicida]